MLDTVREFPVIVVGGGASGLSAAAALSHMGIDAVVLEQDPELGGTWARRYDRLHLHTVRQFSGLAHFPIPSRYPAYLSRDDVVEYLREYARHFGLRVVTCAAVRRIRPRDASSSERWTVETVDGDVWHARVVVIATGQYRQPILPPWPGRESYGGRIAHSAAYTNATPYVGQRVLVVGAGNSGAEIATDLSDNQSVDPAEALDHGRAPGLSLPLVEEVDRAAVPTILGQAEPLADRVGIGLPTAGAADDRPRLRQPLGDLRAEPAADPGDGDHSAV